MSSGRSILSGVLLLGIALAVLGLYVLRTPPATTTADRRPALLRLVQHQEALSAQALARYHPHPSARLDNLANPVEPLLRQLPGVVGVDVAVRAHRPTHRIVHVLDWHYVPRDLYAVDLRHAAGRALSDEEVDRLHEELLLEVEAVQLEQLAVLRALVKHHGLRQVFCEGLSPAGLPAFREKIVALRAVENEHIPVLQRQLQQAKDLKRDATGDDDQAKSAAIEAEVLALLDRHRRELLELGAPGRLAVAGEAEVAALEDAELLDKAKPVMPDGTVRVDAEKVRARHDAIVKAATASGPLAVIVLGGSHDLSASVRQLGGARCEYVRVETRMYRKFSRGDE